jgi:hypothetical protein
LVRSTQPEPRRSFWALDAVIAQVQRHPTLYPLVFGNARRATLRRFPYSLIYTVHDDVLLIAAYIDSMRSDPLAETHLISLEISFEASLGDASPSDQRLSHFRSQTPYCGASHGWRGPCPLHTQCSHDSTHPSLNTHLQSCHHGHTPDPSPVVLILSVNGLLHAHTYMNSDT